MRLITLNTWKGKVHKPLLKFLNDHKNKVDIFTFQEVFKSDRNILTPHKYYSDILGEIAENLDEFNYYFSPTFHGSDEEIKVDYPLSHGNAIFWKKDLNPLEKGEKFLHLRENILKKFPDSRVPDMPVNFQYLKFVNLIVANLHGYWNPAPKTDTSIRINQSKKVIEFYKENKLPFVIAGDFNLRMDTKSVKMLEDAGLRNLVRESKESTTRSKFYDYKWRRIDKFADYIFVSEDVIVYDFKVMKDSVSDHLPLYLNFEV